MTYREAIDEATNELGLDPDRNKAAHLFSSIAVPESKWVMDSQATDEEVQAIKAFIKDALTNPELAEQITQHVEHRQARN